MTDLFDTHAHYDDPAFDGDREELLGTLQEHGIAAVVDVGASIGSCEKVNALMDRYDFLYGAFGVHPSETENLTEADMERLFGLCQNKKCVAVGEIGLDYHWESPDRQVQKKWFQRQLELARQLQKPVIIHSRDAAKDTADLLTAARGQEIGGVIHCYSYTKESAREYLDMGFYFGIGGVLTFRNARKLKEAAAYIPLDRIVLETDCPYLAPEPYRGRRNDSRYLPLVVSALASVKEMDEEEVRRAVWDNSLKLYRLFS